MSETPEPGTPPRVVVAHDYITQRGGAERVVLNLLDAFPGSRLVTAVYSQGTTFAEFRERDVATLWPNKIKAFRRDPRLALPVLAHAWASHRIENADVVLCSTSGWSHGVTSQAPKIAYCHNPARWLYQQDDYLMGAPFAARAVLLAAARPLKRWDKAKAATCASYLANSRAVASRIRSTYGIEASVLAPPVSIDADGPQERIAGIAPGFLLGVSRGRGYKNTQLLCSAVEGVPNERLVLTGTLPSRPRGGVWDERLTGVGFVSDAQLRWLYANCRAVVSASYEDFGLTPLEGNLFGKPAALLRAGGFLDTLVEGVTGCYIEEATEEAIRDALRAIPVVDPHVVRAHGEKYAPHHFGSAVRRVVAEVLQEGRAL